MLFEIYTVFKAWFSKDRKIFGKYIKIFRNLKEFFTGRIAELSQALWGFKMQDSNLNWTCLFNEWRPKQCKIVLRRPDWNYITRLFSSIKTWSSGELWKNKEKNVWTIQKEYWGTWGQNITACLQSSKSQEGWHRRRNLQYPLSWFR